VDFQFHKKTQPLKTTGIPAGGFAPIDRSYSPQNFGGYSGSFDALDGYTKPVGPPTGTIPNGGATVKPGTYLPNNDDGGTGGTSDTRHFPPRNLWNGAFNRQKTLEHYDIMPVPIDGPSTEVVRPVQQANYTLPSPRWTAHRAAPIFRYRRDSYGHEFGDTSINGFPMNDGSHFSMAQSYGANRWIRSKPGTVRTMNRNNITPRNVPTPLDDQVVNNAQRSVRGTAFTSYRNQNYVP
jgi:hypothetical protein